MEGLESDQTVATAWPDIPTSLVPADTGWPVLQTNISVCRYRLAGSTDKPLSLITTAQANPAIWQTKEICENSRHKGGTNQVSAPLIIDPVAGCMTKEMKEGCKNFESVTGMRVTVHTRAGKANKQIAKSNPLKRKKCGREFFFPLHNKGG